MVTSYQVGFKTFIIIIVVILLQIFILETKSQNIRTNEIINTLPKPELCSGRKIHSKLGTTGYFYNWLDPETKKLVLNWFDARNYCQERCMDLISLENLQEIAMLKKYIQFGKLYSVFQYISR